MIRPTFAALALFAAVAASAADPKADAAAAKAALQEVGDFVGRWRGNGESKAGGKTTLWKETQSWGWKFQGDDAWLAFDVADGKFLAKGELRYLPAEKKYRLTAADKDGKTQLYTGELKRGKLVVERTDAKSGDVHRLSIGTAAEGVRLLVQYDVQAGGKGLPSTVYKVAANKEGESFAGGGGKKNECVVTGGLGTIAVSFQGKTYYVCCSGCRDEFDANPKKYVDAFEAAKRKK